MSTVNQFEIIKAQQAHRSSIITLLQEAQLPTEDLPATMDHFFVVLADHDIIAAIGLERYADGGLLRSLVVNKAYRNNNLASALVKALENYATSLGIDRIYLLTETAPSYFAKKGYRQINRTEVPGSIQQSTEFSSVCPVSAIVMKKLITQHE